MLVYPYRIRRDNQGREKCSATMNLWGRMRELSVLKVVLSDPFRVFGLYPPINLPVGILFQEDSGLKEPVGCGRRGDWGSKAWSIEWVVENGRADWEMKGHGKIREDEKTE